ncbi:MAG: 4a-hydroxytetrahydrobiopterin dehydratase, partial [Pseudomonadales bacterium]
MSLADLEFQKGRIESPVDASLAQALLTELPDWQISRSGQDELACEFNFKDFVSAMTFANAVTELAERFNHHPTLVVEYGRVQVKWWTHTAGGIAV